MISVASFGLVFAVFEDFTNHHAHWIPPCFGPVFMDPKPLGLSTLFSRSPDALLHPWVGGMDRPLAGRRMTKRDRKILRRVPAVVGEWSLALPDRAMASSENDEEAFGTCVVCGVKSGEFGHGQWEDGSRFEEVHEMDFNGFQGLYMLDSFWSIDICQKFEFLDIASGNYRVCFILQRSQFNHSES